MLFAFLASVEQAEDGTQRGFGAGRVIEIAAQGTTKRFDTSGMPMREIGEGAIFDFAVFAEGFAEEDGRGRVAVGDGGDVHTDHLSHNPTMSAE